MKWKLVIFFVFTIAISYGQLDSIPSRDSITVPRTTLIKAGETIRTQKDSLVKQNNIIAELENQNQLKSIMLQKSEDELTLLYTRLEISDGIIERYQKYVRREQWYEKTWIHVGSGFVGALVVSIIVRNIK